MHRPPAGAWPYSHHSPDWPDGRYSVGLAQETYASMHQAYCHRPTPCQGTPWWFPRECSTHGWHSSLSVAHGASFHVRHESYRGIRSRACGKHRRVRHRRTPMCQRHREVGRWRWPAQGCEAHRHSCTQLWLPSRPTPTTIYQVLSPLSTP